MIYYPMPTGRVLEDTRTIQHALDQACQQGGGTVWLSAGTAYVCGTLYLRSHVTLHLENGAVLQASPSLEDYFRPAEVDNDQSRGVGTPVLRKPAFVFLYAFDCERVTISGDGRIDGNCYQFVKQINSYHYTGDFYPRPTLIYLEKCNSLKVVGLTLADSPFWTLHMAGCDNVLVQGITIANPLDVANSDGIDPDHCTNVRIIGCHITCADDAICLKNTAGNHGYPPTRNVIISSCTLISTSAALKIGTEGVDDFENILVHHCIISSSNRGVSIQIRDGGSVRNVHFSDLIIETRLFSDEYWGKAEAIALTSFDRDTTITSGTISNVRFSNITSRGEGGVFIASDGSKISDIRFDHVDVILEKTSKWPVTGFDLRPRYKQPLLLKTGVPAFYLSFASKVKFNEVTASITAKDFLNDLLIVVNAQYEGEISYAP